MKFTKQHAHGIILGVMISIIAMNVLNQVYGWSFLAIVLGIVAGLEVGLWVGVPELMKKTHVDIFIRMFGNAPKIARWIGTTFIPGVLILVMFIELSAVLAYGSMLLSDQISVWIDQSFLNVLFNAPPSSHEGVIVISWLCLIVGVCCGCFYLATLMMDSFIEGETIWKALVWGVICGGCPLVPHVVVLIAYLAAAMIALSLCFFTPYVLTALIAAVGKRQAISITAGVIIGSFAGLTVGWTQMNFQLTSLALLIGCSVGLGAGWLVARFSETFSLLSGKLNPIWLRKTICAAVGLR